MLDFFKKQKKLLVVMFFLVLFFWQPQIFSRGIGFIFALFSPFLLAIAIAFVVNLPMTAIEKGFFYRKKYKKTLPLKIVRPIALILSILFFIGLIAFAMLVLVPQLSATILSLSSKIEVFMPKLVAYLSSLTDNPEINNFLTSLNFDEIKNSIFSFLKVGLVNVFDSTINVASGVISLITQLFIAIIFALYLLIGKEKLSLQFKRVLFALWPIKRANSTLRILSMTRKSFISFITGQSLEAIILFVLMLIVLLIFRIPFPLLISIIIAFTSLIPIVGAFAGAGMGTFLILIENPTQALYFLIIFLVVQQIEGNLIYPRVVGNSIGLPGMWVLAAVSIGGALAGVIGILLCIPLAAVAYALFREYVNAKLESKKIVIKEEDNG